MTSLQEQLPSVFPDWQWQFNFPLAQQTYFKVGGPAESYIEVAEKEKAAALVRWCAEQRIPLTLLGGGSNVIVSDAGVPGVVVKLLNDTFEVGAVADGLTTVLAGAGLKTALLVKQTVDVGLSGLEFFLGVPGTLGGAVYNNAHYLKDLISAHINRVEILTRDGTSQWLSKQECEFGYDTSRFQRTKEIVWQVEFLLPAGEHELSRERIKEATLYRAQTQPLGLPSSGCIFQNVPNTPELRKQFPRFADQPYVPGGFLIDQAGLKKTRQGDIEVSEKHAAFFVNRGKGTAADIRTLIQKVKQTVKEKFGADLREEVFWLGKP
jgi:UDP-N-acetylmuramate dehydrogenase